MPDFRSYDMVVNESKDRLAAKNSEIAQLREKLKALIQANEDCLRVWRGPQAKVLAAALKQAKRREPCIGNDPSCPCQDGDMCHYRGPNAWPIPKEAPDA